MDLECQRNRLVIQANADKERLDRLLEEEAEENEDEDEDEDDDSDEDESDDDEGWERGERRVGRRPGREAVGPGQAAPVQQPGHIHGGPGNDINDRRGRQNHQHQRPTRRMRRRERRIHERNLRHAKIRNSLARRRAAREKHLSLLKHDFIMRSLRLFKLFLHGASSVGSRGGRGDVGVMPVSTAASPVVAIPASHKVVMLDSWVSAGHELFCNTVEPPDDEMEEGGDLDNNGSEFDDDFDSDDDDSDSSGFDEEYDDMVEEDLGGGEDETDLELTDSDERMMGASLDGGETLDDADTFALGKDESTISGGGIGGGQSVLSKRGQGGVEFQDSPRSHSTPRRSTVTINDMFNPSSLSSRGEILGALSTSAVVLPAGILSPVPVRPSTPVASILNGDHFRVHSSLTNGTNNTTAITADLPPLSPTSAEEASLAAASVAAILNSAPPTEMDFYKTKNSHLVSSPPPTASTNSSAANSASTSNPPTTTTAITTTTPTVPPSAFRSNPGSVSTSTNHLNFSLKTKIKTTDSSDVGIGDGTLGGFGGMGGPTGSGNSGGGSGFIGGGSGGGSGFNNPNSSGFSGVSAAGSISRAGGGGFSPPPPMSPNQLRPRKFGRSGSSINDKLGGGGGGGGPGSARGSSHGGGRSSGGLYYSHKSWAAAQSRLERCFEVVFGEVCSLAGCGALDEWVTNGGGEAMAFSQFVRNELAKKEKGHQHRGNDSDSEESGTDEDEENDHRVARVRNTDVAPAPSPPEYYTDDIVRYAHQYGLHPHGQTLINLLLCLFDMLQAVRRVPRSTSSSRHNRYSSRASNTSSSHYRHPLFPRRATFASPTYAGFPYTLKDGDLTVSEGFDLQHNDILDGYVAGVVAGCKNVRIVQFLIKTLLVDHEVGVGKRAGKAVVEGMRAINSGMKVKVRLN